MIPSYLMEKSSAEIENPNVKPFSQWGTRDVLKRDKTTMTSERLLVKTEEGESCNKAYSVLRIGEEYQVQKLATIIINPTKLMEKVGELP